MTKKITLATLALMVLFCFSTTAEPIKIKGIYNHSFHDGTDYTGVMTVPGVPMWAGTALLARLSL